MQEKLLSSVGIDGSEAAVYRAVLKARSATPAVLAKLTSIKRTTAYYLAQSLAQKGLLIEDATKRPRVFVPATPKDIEQVIDREHQLFAARKQILQTLATELSRATAEGSYSVPQIRFVEEEKLRHFMKAQLLTWHKSAITGDATWWGFQDHTFLEQYGDLTAWYWKYAKESVAVKLLSNESSAERRLTGKYPRRTIKFWKNAENFITTKWIVGSYVIMVNTRKHPYYLVEIHDATFANDEREVFKNLWALL